MYRITIYCTNIKRSIAFYENLFEQSVNQQFIFQFNDFQIELVEQQEMLKTAYPILSLFRDSEKIIENPLLNKYIEYSESGIHVIDPDQQSIKILSTQQMLNLEFSLVTQRLPDVIKQEFEHLLKFIRNGQVYGALLQLKDCFEVTFKLIAIVAVGEYMVSKENKIPLLNLLLLQPLSIGHWLNILKFFKNNGTLNPMLTNIIQDLLLLDSKYYISKWRNDNIGHGALMLDEKKCLDEKIIPYLNILVKHYEDYATFYEKLKTSLHINEQITYQTVDQNIPLEPFLTVNENNVFFFDSFVSGKKKSVFLDYRNGLKKSNLPGVHQKIQALYKNVGKNITNGSKKQQILTAEMENILASFEEIDEFVKPQYLLNTLLQWLEDHSKGLFHYQMQEGMGKTAFIKSIDSAGKYKLLKPHKVVSIYCNDQYGSGAIYFVESLTDALRKPHSIKNIAPLTLNRQEAAEDFIRFLNHYYDAFKQLDGENKLIVCIDGLDELVYQEQLTVFDYLPNEAQLQQLQEGIYIVITSRTIDECSQFVKQKLDKCTLTEKPAIFTKNDDEYKLIIKSLIEDPEFLQTVNYNFRYVQVQKQLAKYADYLQKDSIQSLTNQIHFLYGDKFFEQYIKLLLVLASAQRPLTLQEIVYLLDEEMVTYELLACLADMKNLLTIKRTAKGNAFELTEQSWKKYFTTYYAEQYKALLQQWREQITEPKPITSILEDEEGYLYLFFNLYNIDASLSSWMTEINQLNKCIVAASERVGYKKEAIKTLMQLVPKIKNKEHYLDIGCALADLLYSEHRNEECLALVNELLVQYKNYKKLIAKPKRDQIYLGLLSAKSAVQEMICPIEDVFKTQRLIQQYFTNYNDLFSLLDWATRQMQLLIRVGKIEELNSLKRFTEKKIPNRLNRYEAKMVFSFYTQYINVGLQLNKPQEVERYLNKVATLLESIGGGTTDMLAKYYELKGQFHYVKDEYKMALHYIEQSIQQYESALAKDEEINFVEYCFALLNLVKWKAEMNPLTTGEKTFAMIRQFIQVHNIKHEQLLNELQTLEAQHVFKKMKNDKIIEGLNRFLNF